MTVRKLFTKIHLWLAIPLGIVISVVCLSGASLVFEQEITRMLNPQLYSTEPSSEAQPMTPSRLVTRIREQVPDTLHLISLQMSGDPRKTCMVSFRESGRRQLSVDPYTGDVKGWTKTPAFFQTMRKLHRWLMDAPQRKGEKTAGKTIVGISTLAMVFILISGLIIWVPRSRKALRTRLKVSCSNGWRRFWYDSHVVLGFYATLLLLVMALTGLTWSFGWYRTAAYSLFGGNGSASAPARAAEPSDRGNSHTPRHGKAFDYAVWDKAFEEIRIQYPVYKTVTLSEKNIHIAPDPSSHMRRTDTASFDPRSGMIVKISKSTDVPPAQNLKGWFYAFHTGTWGGTTIKVLYFLAALIGGTLPLTGYYLWLKRKNGHKRNRLIVQ